MSQFSKSITYFVLLYVFLSIKVAVDGFQRAPVQRVLPGDRSIMKGRSSGAIISTCRMAVETGSDAKKSGGYEPKWKKKKTLAEEVGNGVGIVGNIPIVFRQGNETRKTMALAGSPLSFAAAQAGQPIRYGCKKGECGTCEAMCNGKWVRPCVALVPELPPGEELVLQIKAVKKAKSSGKFFSVRSFFMGFYNNLLGMVGFVKQRRAAKKNYEERMEIEELIRKKTLEKKKARGSL
jgi:ferredoxin